MTPPTPAAKPPAKTLVQATATAQQANTEKSIVQHVRENAPAFEAQLAGAMNTGAFVRAALSSIKGTELEQASASSVLGSLLLAAQLRLEIGSALGHFYLTPRRVKGDMTCVPIIGYRGLIELAYRSGRIEKVESFLVREGDKFEHGADHREGRWFNWQPVDYDASRPWIGVVALGKVKGGVTVWAYLTRAEVLARRPDNWARGPWATHEPEMARKTAVRDLATYLPMSTELARALESDENVVEKVVGVDELIVVRQAQTPTPEPVLLEPTEPAPE